MEINQDFISAVNDQSLVEAVRAELTEIDSLAVEEHAQRFEILHQKLNQALSAVDGM